MANKPIIYSGLAYSTGSYTLNPPTPGTDITRIITSIRLSNVVNSPGFIAANINWGGYGLFGSGNFLTSDNILEYSNQYIIQNDDAAHTLQITSTASYPTNYTMIMIEAIEIDRSDDSDISFFGQAQTITGQFIGNTVLPTQRAIIKQLHIEDLGGSPGIYRVGTNSQLGEGNYNLVPTTELGKTYIEDLNAVISNDTNDNLVVTALTVGTQFKLVYFGTLITL